MPTIGETGERAAFRVQLADSLIGVYERGGDLAVLNRAIANLSAAVAIDTSNDVRAVALDRLGIAFKLRHRATDNADDLQTAVEVHRRATESLPTSSLAYAAAADHYAQALRAAYELTGDMSRLDESIRIGHLACQNMENTAERAIALGNLANSLATRGSARRRPKDFDEGLHLIEEAVGLKPPSSTLSFLFVARFNLLLRGMRRGRSADAVRRAWEELDLERIPAVTRFSVAANGCNGFFEESNFGQTVTCYRAARKAAEELVLLGEISERGKAGWIGDFQWLVGKAAYSLARLGKEEEAVCEIEGTSAAMLRERTRMGGAAALRLRATGKIALAKRLERWLDLQTYLSDVGATHFADLHSAKEERGALLSKALRASALEGVWDEVEYADVAAALPRGQVAAYILATWHGGVTLIASSKGVDAIWNPRLTSAKTTMVNYGRALSKKQGRSSLALDKAAGWIGGLARWRAALASDETIDLSAETERWEAELKTALQSFQSEIGVSLESHPSVARAKRIVLLPQLELASWPVGSASIGGSGSAELSPTTCAPSLIACAELQRFDAARSQPRFLAVGDPANSGLPALPAAAAEVRIAASHFPGGTALVGKKASLSAFQAACVEADIWHFAGHAYFNLASSGDASLLFSGGDAWNLAEIRSTIGSAPQLVVLSACDAGAFDLSLASERPGLATAFLELGARRVLAPLWPVEDTASMLFMALFYERLAGGDQPAAALRASQAWMRGTTDGVKLGWVRARIAAMPAASRADWMPIYRVLALCAYDGGQFAKPLHWAGYQMHGTGK